MLKPLPCEELLGMAKDRNFIENLEIKLLDLDESQSLESFLKILYENTSKNI